MKKTNRFLTVLLTLMFLVAIAVPLPLGIAQQAYECECFYEETIIGSVKLETNYKAYVYIYRANEAMILDSEVCRVEIETDIDPGSIDYVILTNWKELIYCWWGVKDKDVLFVNFWANDFRWMQGEGPLHIIILTKN